MPASFARVVATSILIFLLGAAYFCIFSTNSPIRIFVAATESGGGSGGTTVPAGDVLDTSQQPPPGSEFARDTDGNIVWREGPDSPWKHTDPGDCPNSDCNGDGIPDPTSPPATPAPSPPIPTGLNAICSADGATATLNWDDMTSAGASYYSVRVDSSYSSWDGSCTAPDICADVTSPSYLVSPATPGIDYGWWVHSRNAAGAWSDAAYGSAFTCVASPPTCTVDLVPASSTINVSSSSPLVASFSESTGTITEVHFGSRQPGSATVSPSEDTSSPYGTTATGVALGTATIDVVVHMTTPGHDHEEACSDTASVQVTNPPGWWQTKDADVWSRGDLVSNIPVTYDGNKCDGRYFSCIGDGGYPGVIVYNGSVNFNYGGLGSSKGWLANSGYAGTAYNYNWFENKIPSGIEVNTITDSPVNGGYFASNGTPSQGYVWFKRTGDLTINSQVNLNNRKVVLFVTGNLTIDGRVNFNKGSGFFMTIVGGNINIDKGVSHPSQPALEGAYFANGNISTGTGGTASDSQLYIRGSLVANGAINLQRDLGPSNQNTPAELIEFAPDLIFTYPKGLGTQNFIWHEIAP